MSSAKLFLVLDAVRCHEYMAPGSSLTSVCITEDGSWLCPQTGASLPQQLLGREAASLTEDLSPGTARK